MSAFIIDSDERALLRESVGKLATKYGQEYFLERSRSGAKVDELWRDLGQAGLLGVHLPEEYGGGGAGLSEMLIVIEELAAHGFPLLLAVVSPAICGSILAAHGSERMKTEWLPGLADGSRKMAFGLTEPDAGSNSHNVSTTARRDGDDWVIDGTKMYITNGIQADWICVLARTSDEGGYRGMSQIIVPADTPGFKAEKLDKLGMRASDTALLTFDNVRVPVGNTIGEIGRGFQQQMVQFVVERTWGVYNVHVACTEALERTKAYALQRKVFGAPLAANQYLQYTYAELAAKVDLLREYGYAMVDAHMAGQNITRMATIAKLEACRLVRQVGDWCLQVHGGIGYMEETWTSRFVRDQRLPSIGGGADEVMLRVLSQIDGFTA